MPTWSPPCGSAAARTSPPVRPSPRTSPPTPWPSPGRARSTRKGGRPAGASGYGGGAAMAYDSGRLKLFAGSANPALARAIAQHIGVPLGDLELGRFANGEVRVSVNESVRGADVFVIQP